MKLVKNGLKILDAQIEAKQVESDPTMAKKPKSAATAKTTKEPEKSKSATVPSRSKKTVEPPKVVDLTMDDDPPPVNNNNEINEKIKVFFIFERFMSSINTRFF